MDVCFGALGHVYLETELWSTCWLNAHLSEGLLPCFPTQLPHFTSLPVRHINSSCSAPSPALPTSYFLLPASYFLLPTCLFTAIHSAGVEWSCAVILTFRGDFIPCHQQARHRAACTERLQGIFRNGELTNLSGKPSFFQDLLVLPQFLL